MSEKLRLTCLCGYENWVRPELLGQTIECAMCGANLVADEAAVGGHFESPDAADFEDETAPESPTTPPHRQAVFDDGITLEERVERERKKRPKPLSPFDADEDEERAPLPPPADEPKRNASSPGQPRPRARSPFEADQPEEEQKPRGTKTSTIEAGARTSDGTSYADLIDDNRPKERRNRHVIVETVSPHDAPSGETCAECGRAIRGSWDRVETEKGVICYVCSNQAVAGIPDRLKSDTPKRRELGESDLVTEPVVQQDDSDDRVAWYKDTESPEFKRVIFFLAVFTLMVAGYFFFFDSSPAPSSDTPEPTARIQDVELTPFSAALFQGWQILSFTLSLFFAVYLSLKSDGATPHGDLLRDVLFIGAVCVPLSVFYFLAQAVAMFIGQLPMAGGIFVVLIGLARWIIIYMVLTRFIYMRFSQVLIAAVIYFALRRILFPALGVLIFRAMGIL